MVHWPLHKSIMIVDVEKSGERGELFLFAMRKALYSIMETAFQAAGLDWAATEHEDRGDGILILIPGGVPKVVLLDPLLGQLGAALRHHAALSSAAAQIRLRVVLHAGEIQRDDHGFAGRELNHAFRLGDARQCRAALTAVPPAHLVLIVSDAFYRAAVLPGLRSIDPASYRRVAVSVKETFAPAWVHVPGHAELPDLEHLPDLELPDVDGAAPTGASTSETPPADDVPRATSTAEPTTSPYGAVPPAGPPRAQPPAGQPAAGPVGPVGPVGTVGTMIFGGVAMGDNGSIGGHTVGRDMTRERDEP
jgi:hypothetical protein